MKIAVIFPDVINCDESPDIPYQYLAPLNDVGILDIVLLLNNKEYLFVTTTKIALLAWETPTLITEYFPASFNIQIINTNEATTVEEKLNYYLTYAQGEAELNLVLCNQELPWVAKELNTTKQPLETVEWEIGYKEFSFTFFKQTERTKLPLFKAPCSTAQAIQLYQHDLNPCFCYTMSVFDIDCKWLFNIFVELISLELKLQKIPDTLDNFLIMEFQQLIHLFNKNLVDWEKAEERFEKTFRIVTQSVPSDFIIKWMHEQNITNRTKIYNNFSKLIRDFIHLYDNLIVNRSLEISMGKPPSYL